jgi:adenosine deaminase
MDTLETIRALPKAEQHIHLVGSTNPETLLWLAKQGDIEVPFETVDEVRKFFSYTDFDHFIRVYSTVVDCITKEAQFERIAYEMLEAGHGSNVRDFEASFSAPDHVRKGLDYTGMLNAINNGLRRGKKDYGVGCRLRIDLVRNYGPEYGMEVLDWIERHGENIIAIDIGGSEKGYPPEPYAPVYKRAKNLGLRLVAHAGEAAGLDSVWGAVKGLGVERIGHGTIAAKDPELMRFIAERNVTIETCPVSNVRTGAIASVADHPIRKFIKNGIRVTVNSDDPSMFGTNMNNEYIQLHEQLGFTVPELFQLSLNAIDSAFLPEHNKAELKEQYVNEYGKLMK